MMKNCILPLLARPYTTLMKRLPKLRPVMLGGLIGMLLVPLSACAPRSALAPALVTRFSTQNNPITLNEANKLTAYPGSQILTLEDTGARTTARFLSNATLFTLESYFETQLTTEGWRRLNYDPPNNTRSSVVYKRAGERVRLKLALEDPSGRYLLTLR